MKVLPVVLAAFAVSSYAATTGLKLSAQATQLEEETVLFPDEVVAEQTEPEVVAPAPTEEVPTEVPVEVTVAEPVAVPVNEEDVFGEPVVEEKPEIVAEEAPEVVEAKPEVVEEEPEVVEAKPEIIEEEPEVLEAKPEVVVEEVPVEVKGEIVAEEEIFFNPPVGTYDEGTTIDLTEDEPVAGGVTDVDLTTVADDKDIQNILDLGVETLLKTVSEEGNLPTSDSPFRISEIRKIQTQVVSGTNYFCDVVLRNDGNLRIYATFTVFSQPWTNTLKVTDGCVKIGKWVNY